MRLTLVALTLVATFAACGSDEDAGSTTTSSAASTTAAPTTTTTTTSTTTAPASSTVTTTSEPPSTTTTVPTAPWDDGRYRVVNVAADDVLNVRQSPGADQPIVGALAPNGLAMLDGYSASVGSSQWFSVTLDDGTIGWVNGAFLAPPAGWELPLDQVACSPDGAGYGGTQEISGDGLGEGAGNVLSVFTYSGTACDRIVLVLGEGAGFRDAGWVSTPAGSVPVGTSVTSAGSVIEIRIPGVTEARPIAQTTEAAFAFVLATRDEPLSGGAGDLTFRAFFDANRRAAVTWLPAPARVVIDILAAPTGTGLDVAAKRSGTTVVMPIQVDLNGPGVSTPIDVTGWGRPFESQGVAVLRTAADQPGTGDLVEATFSGTSFAGTQTTAQYPYMTADYTEAWGAFAFTIDGLAPGTYELFVGDFNMESGEPEGVYQTFTVAT